MKPYSMQTTVNLLYSELLLNYTLVQTKSTSQTAPQPPGSSHSSHVCLMCHITKTILTDSLFIKALKDVNFSNSLLGKVLRL